MTEDEYSIINFLKQSPDNLFTRREIARKAVKRNVFEENNHWADAPLAALVARREVEQDDAGLYRVRRSA